MIPLDLTCKHVIIPAMATGTMSIDLDAIISNWLALDAMSDCETAAVVKANAYGLGAVRIVNALAGAGARKFFVAVAEEGVELRENLGPGPEIYVLSGLLKNDIDMIRGLGLTPIISSVEQMICHAEAMPEHPFGLQFDTGMNRLGLEPVEWQELRTVLSEQNPTIVMSHLACADEPNNQMNERQLHLFREMVYGLQAPLSLSNTGGILLGPEYHFDLTRPGIGVYGGAPFSEALQVVDVHIPVIQCRTVHSGETVGYGNSYAASRDIRVATLSAGYADGIFRSLNRNAKLFADGLACPIVGKISMDLICVDISELSEDPVSMQFMGSMQGIDLLADYTDTIGYELLTSLGSRYARHYVGG